MQLAMLAVKTSSHSSFYSMQILKILYEDNLVLISKSLENLGETFLQWKGAFKSMELKLISRPN